MLNREAAAGHAAARRLGADHLDGVALVVEQLQAGTVAAAEEARVAADLDHATTTADNLNPLHLYLHLGGDGLDLEALGESGDGPGRRDGQNHRSVPGAV